MLVLVPIGSDWLWPDMFAGQGFNADFGPLNLSSVCRYCRVLDAKLKDSKQPGENNRYIYLYFYIHICVAITHYFIRICYDHRLLLLTTNTYY